MAINPNIIIYIYLFLLWQYSNTEGSIRFKIVEGIKKFLGNNGTVWRPLSLWDENAGSNAIRQDVVDVSL